MSDAPKGRYADLRMAQTTGGWDWSVKHTREQLDDRAHQEKKAWRLACGVPELTDDLIREARELWAKPVLTDLEEARLGWFQFYHDDLEVYDRHGEKYLLCICAPEAWRLQVYGPQAHIERANLPKKLAGMQLQDVKTPTPEYGRIKASVETFLDGFVIRYFEKPIPETGLLFFGPKESGKSFMMACVVASLAGHNIKCLWTDAQDWLQDLKDSFDNTEGKPRREIFEDVAQVPVLALDDIASKPLSDFDRDQVQALIDWRYRNQLPIFATTNLSPRLTPKEQKDPSAESALERALGGRAFSRLMAMAQVIGPFPDYRWRQRDHEQKRQSGDIFGDQTPKPAEAPSGYAQPYR